MGVQQRTRIRLLPAANTGGWSDTIRVYNQGLSFILSLSLSLTLSSIYIYIYIYVSLFLVRDAACVSDFPRYADALTQGETRAYTGRIALSKIRY